MTSGVAGPVKMSCKVVDFEAEEEVMMIEMQKLFKALSSHQGHIAASQHLAAILRPASGRRRWLGCRPKSDGFACTAHDPNRVMSSQYTN